MQLNVLHIHQNKMLDQPIANQEIVPPTPKIVQVQKIVYLKTSRKTQRSHGQLKHWVKL